MNKTIRTRIEMQGFTELRDSEMSEIRPWIKLAPALCLPTVGIGIVTQSPIAFAILIPNAALGKMLRWHPFDLFYSLMIRHWIQGPPIPPYRAPRKFACGVTTAWLTAIFVAFNADHIATGNVLAGMFLVTAALPVVLDFCVLHSSTNDVKPGSLQNDAKMMAPPCDESFKNGVGVEEWQTSGQGLINNRFKLN